MSRCAACPGVHRCLPPDGPMQQGGLLFIGEAPGRDEEKKGRVFIGKTGMEVDGHYLPVAGLKRSQVLFTNAIRCLPSTPGNKLDSGNHNHQALLDTCANHFLYPLIERLQPRLLVPLGSFACRAVCPDVDLELGHGIPVQSPWGIPVLPMYHPALGIHEPKKMLYIRTDWFRLKQYLRGQLARPVDAYPNPDYQEATLADIQAIAPTQVLAADTESKRTKEPHCLTYSQTPGWGRLIRADGDRRLMEAFGRKMRQHRAPVLFHNWLHDAAVVEKLGLEIPAARIVDTMASVFHLGNLPQGLKALAYRLLGMEMQDFLDLVTPYSREQVVTYYRLAALFEYEKPPEMLVDDGAGGFKLYKPQSMTTKLKRFFTDLSKDPEHKDVFGVWEKWDRATIEANCGEWPGLCISHVPFEKTLYYACRDVDALIRLWPVLKAMRRRVRRTPQELWAA